MRYCKPEEIRIGEPFEGLFPIDNQTLDAIAAHMEANGFDDAHPLIGWTERKVLIDGHTRLMAATIADIKSVPIIWHSFQDEDAAVEYAIHCQRDRRNLTDADVLRWVSELDKRRKHGGDRKSDDFNATPVAMKRSAEETAAALGVNRGKIEKARTVLDHADAETKAAVEAGEMTINAAYKTTQETRRTESEKTISEPIQSAPSRGLEIAKTAIAILKTIRADDLQRENAFDLVRGWIIENE